MTPRAASGAPVEPLGQHSTDRARRRKSKRSGRQRGAWLYLTAAELRAIGIELDAPPPTFRVWVGRRRSLTLTLYDREPGE